MDQDFKDLNEPMMAEAPDDVSTLYSWANLHGSKYRDFSAARREHRAQVRQSMTEQDPLVGNPPQAPYAPPPMSSGQPNVGPGSGMGVPLGEERYAPYSSPTPERVSPAVVYVREYGGPAYAPPAPAREVIGVAPAPGYFWSAGYYGWYGGRYVWVGGRWMAPRPGYAWVQPHWARGPGGWRFVGGHWR